MYHHDNRNYDEATSAAAKYAREKLTMQIEKGREKAGELYQQVIDHQPVDVIRKGQELAEAWMVIPQDTGPAVVVLGKPEKHWRVHRHALGQACQRGGMPQRYLEDLLERGSGWAAELAQKNLRELYAHSSDRLLLRATRLNGHGTPQANLELRGLLSDRYRRLDSRPIFDAFAGASEQLGLVPIDAVTAATKWSIRSLLQVVREPVPNEVVAFGLALRNSDFGDGKLELSAFILRCWCTNLAMASNELSQVHLGGRLPENLRLSQQTYDLDTQTMASAITDLTHNALSPARVDSMCETIKEAHEAKLEWSQAEKLVKAKLQKAELEEAKSLFEAPDNGDATPGGDGTRWKLANVVSWLANKATPDRKMELQEAAGGLAALK